MSICVRPANQMRRSRICAGHSGLMQRRAVSRSLSSRSISSGPEHLGHSVGGSNLFRDLCSFESGFTTSMTCGMISPAFSTITVSPMRMSFSASSPKLCSVAWLTIVPASRTGSMTARGVILPVLPTWISMSFSSVGLRSAGYL